jgi:hypothetical protein
LRALGDLTLNGHSLCWSGSKTSHQTDVKIFSNGNAVIHHVDDPITDNHRQLDEASRFTPPLIDDDHIDVGFIGCGNDFIGVRGSYEGKLDIFEHDFVVPCHQKYFKGNSTLTIENIDGIDISSISGGAFSAGPELTTMEID